MPTLQELKEALARGANQELERTLPPEPPPIEGGPPGTELVDVGEEPPPPQPGAASLPPPEVEEAPGLDAETSEERKNRLERLIYGQETPLFSGENAGMLGGGMAAAWKMPGPPAVKAAAGLVGAVVGAMGGASVDEGVKEVWQQATGTDESPEEERGWLDVIGKAGMRGVWNEVAGQVAGFALNPLRKLAGGPLAKQVSEDLWKAWEAGGEGLANQFRWIKREYLNVAQPYMKSALGMLKKMDEKQERRLSLVREREKRLAEYQEFGVPPSMTALYQEGKGGVFSRLGESIVTVSSVAASTMDHFIQRQIKSAEEAWYKLADKQWGDYAKRMGLPFRSTKEALDEAGRLVFAKGKEDETKWRAAGDELFERARLAFGEGAGSASPALYGASRDTIRQAMSRRGLLLDNVADRARFRADPRAGADSSDIAEAAELVSRWSLFPESPIPLTLDRLWGYYKELGAKAGAAKLAGGGGTSSVWSKLFAGASRDIDQLAESMPGPAKEAFLAANKLWKIKVARNYLENETWQKMLKKDQSEIGEMLLNKHTSPEDIQRMVRAFGAEGFDRLKAGWAYSLVRRVSRDSTKPSLSAPNEGEGLFSMYKVLKETSEDAIQPKVFRALMGKNYPEAQRLRKLLQRIVETRVFKQGSNLARNMDATMATQRVGVLTLGTLKAIAGGGGVGAAGGQLFGGDPLTIGTIGAASALIGPLALGRLLFTKGGLKWLIEGAEMESKLGKRVFPKGGALSAHQKQVAQWVGKLGHVLATSRAPWESEQGPERGQVPLELPPGP